MVWVWHWVMGSSNEFIFNILFLIVPTGNILVRNGFRTRRRIGARGWLINRDSSHFYDSSYHSFLLTLLVIGVKYSFLSQQFHERTKTASSAIRDGDVVDPLRRLLCAARLHRATPLLHRTLGPCGVPTASPHLLQPPGSTPLSYPPALIRKATTGRRRNQYVRHWVNLSAIKLRNAI